MNKKNLPEPKSSDFFNENNYSQTLKGIKIYVTERVTPGSVIRGETIERNPLVTNIKIKSRTVDLSRLKKIHHLAVHPRSLNSLVKNLKDSIEKEYQSKLQ